MRSSSAPAWSSSSRASPRGRTAPRRTPRAGSRARAPAPRRAPPARPPRSPCASRLRPAARCSSNRRRSKSVGVGLDEVAARARLQDVRGPSARRRRETWICSALAASAGGASSTASSISRPRRRPRSRAEAAAPAARAACCRRAGSGRRRPRSRAGRGCGTPLKALAVVAVLQPAATVRRCARQVGSRPHRTVGTKGRTVKRLALITVILGTALGARAGRLGEVLSDGGGTGGRAVVPSRRPRIPRLRHSCPQRRAGEVLRNGSRHAGRAAPQPGLANYYRLEHPDVPARHPRRQRRHGDRPISTGRLVRLEHDHRRNARRHCSSRRGGDGRHPAQAQPQLLKQRTQGRDERAVWPARRCCAEMRGSVRCRRRSASA